MVHKTLCLISTHSSPLRNFSHVLKQQFLQINQSNLGKVPTPDLYNQLSGFADSYTYSAKNTVDLEVYNLFSFWFQKLTAECQSAAHNVIVMHYKCDLIKEKEIQVHSNRKAAQRCALVQQHWLSHNHCYVEKPGLKCR